MMLTHLHKIVFLLALVVQIASTLLFISIIRSSSRFQRAVGLALLVSGLALLADSIGIFDERDYLFWRRIALSIELLLPAVFSFIAISFLDDPSSQNRTASWWSRLWAYLGLGGGLMAYLWWQDGSVLEKRVSMVFAEVLISPAWQVCHIFILVGITAGLSQFEQLYRSLTETARFKLKPFLIGLGSIAFYEVCQAAQVLLTPLVQAEDIGLRILTTGFSTLFITHGYRRNSQSGNSTHIKVSAELVYGSASILWVGIYLLGVGMVWQWIRSSEFQGRSLLATSMGFLSVLALVIVTLSRSWQIRARQFLAKHVIRSKHDYRAKWLEVTDSFAKTRSADEILDRLLAVLSRTFSTGRISIWMLYDSDKRFHRAQTINPQESCEPLGTDNVLVAQLEASDDPVNLSSLLLNTPRGASLSQFLLTTQAELCVPIKVQDRLVAMMVLGPQEGEKPYEFDDVEVLQMIAHHVSVLLSHAHLAEKSAASAELDAFHRFSAFCLHDIKNLAARLSLVVQNAEVHGTNPDFQRTAMQAVSRTVDRMMTLMSKLSARSWEERTLEEVDLHAVVQECLQFDGLNLRIVARVSEHDRVTVLGDRLEIYQLILNIVLNAQQAGATEVTVEIERGPKRHDILLLVSDNGSGIPEEQLRTIFQPLQTTKRQGLGVGLFQCRQIVEEYGGSIRMRSTVGHGTCVIISFPAPVGSQPQRPVPLDGGPASSNQ